MDGNNLSLGFSECERKRNGFRLVISAVQQKGYLSRPQIHHLAVTAVIIDNRRKFPMSGDV
jgi:hypothetical protein